MKHEGNGMSNLLGDLMLDASQVERQPLLSSLVIDDEEDIDFDLGNGPQFTAYLQTDNENVTFDRAYRKEVIAENRPIVEKFKKNTQEGLKYVPVGKMSTLEKRSLLDVKGGYPYFALLSETFPDLPRQFDQEPQIEEFGNTFYSHALQRRDEIGKPRLRFMGTIRDTIFRTVCPNSAYLQSPANVNQSNNYQ